MIALSAKNKLGFVDGTVAKPDIASLSSTEALGEMK